MALNTIESVASFSVVLGEAFAAVALSTLVPATFVTTVRGAKKAIAAAADDAQRASAASDAKNGLGALVNKGPGRAVLNSLIDAAQDTSGIDLLVPRTAKIHAEFEFEGSEAYDVEAGLGAQVQVVTVKAGMSALYASTSRNKVTLDVDFVAVHYEV